MFERVARAPDDPILGLTDAFKAEPRPGKINLGVGVFKDEEGNTPVLATVKEAEDRLVNTETSKGYLPIEGRPAYAEAVQRLVLGADNVWQAEGRVCTAQAPGGTGALRVGAEFLRHQLGIDTIWVSDPTWANHQNIFRAAGLTLKTYRYFNPETHGLDFDGMCADLDKVGANEAVLLHACCHNPTGADPTPAQWQQLGERLAVRGILPFFDFAYQGFGAGLEDDAAGLRAVLQAVPEALVANSFSKNFGLYNERVGALTVVTSEASASTAVLSQLKGLIRALYSNPPSHGASVVETILLDPELRVRWQDELAAMRQRINGLRHDLVAGLKAQGTARDFSFIVEQNGMFSYSGLTREQVGRLRDEHAIYIVGSGRINIAGIQSDNLDVLCQSIAAVL